MPEDNAVSGVSWPVRPDVPAINGWVTKKIINMPEDLFNTSGKSLVAFHVG